MYKSILVMKLFFCVVILSSFSACVNHARLFRYAQNNPDKAIDITTNRLKENPNDTMMYYVRGIAYMTEKKYDLAKRDFDYLITKGTHDGGIFYNRGLVNFSLKNFDNAIEDMTTAISYFDNDVHRARGLLMRGSIYHYDLNNYEKALEDYDNSILLNSSHLNAPINKAQLFFDLKKYQESIALFDDLLKRNPKNAKALNDFAWILIIAPEEYQDKIRSLSLAKQAVSLSPNIITYDTLALAFAANNEFNMAIENQEKAYKLFDSNFALKKGYITDFDKVHDIFSGLFRHSFNNNL